MRSFIAGFVSCLLLIAAVGMFASVRAQWAVSIYGLSKHSEAGYCEINPGLSASYTFTKDLRLGHGRFLNSQCAWSNATGAIYTPFHVGRWSFGVALLRVTAYKDKPAFVPLPVGSYAFDKRHAVDFFIAHKGDESVAGAAWRINF